MAQEQQFASFEDLVEFIRNWRAWSGGEQYDFGGMAALLGACLDNLRQFALDVELDELADFLEPEQVDFLRGLADLSARERSDL